MRYIEMIKLLLKTERQFEIADALWAANSKEDVLEVLAHYGPEAEAISNYMIAELIDTFEDSHLRESNEELYKIMYPHD